MIPASLIAVLLLWLSAVPRVQAAQLPPCLVGNFRYASFDTLVQNVLPQASGSITVASGEALNTLRADGAFENTYRQLTLAATVGDTPYTMTFDGWEKGTIREAGPGRLTSTTTDASLTVTITSQGRSESTTINGPIETTASLEYECRGDRVITQMTMQPTLEGSPATMRTETVRIN
jgi:hypothetical protein